MSRELSIFIDESGDFGPFDSHSPYYIFSLVLHDQGKSITEENVRLEDRLSYAGMSRSHCFHTMPLIRGELDYHAMDLKERRKLLGYLFAYMRAVPVRYSTITAEKTGTTTVIDLTMQLSKKLGEFLLSNQAYLRGFKKIIIYYDNGQTELTRIIVSVFTIMFPNVEFRRVEPSEYRLFQIADLCCTMKLISLKYGQKKLNKYEEYFFGGYKNLKKNYLNHLRGDLL